MEIYFIIIILVTFFLFFIFINQKESNQKISDDDKMINVRSKPIENFQGLELIFCNQGLRDLDIYAETSKITDLTFLFTISPESCVYVYPSDNDIKYFTPGVVYFSKDKNGEFVYKPYALRDVDEIIYFGEVSTDFMRSQNTLSERNEILSLNIENRSLKDIDLWYRGVNLEFRDYLGHLEGYHPASKKFKYSMLTTDNDKHFTLGGWIEFKLQDSDSQFVQLRDKFTTDLYIGDVIGRTKYNA